MNLIVAFDDNYAKSAKIDAKLHSLALKLAGRVFLVV